MLDKVFIYLFQKTKPILIVGLIIFGSGTCYLIFKWGENANTFGHSILIEFFIGGLFTIVPVFLGVYIGKKYKEIQFYNRIKNLLNTIKLHRKSGDITSAATRNIVI